MTFKLQLREDRPATIEEHRALRTEIERLSALLVESDRIADGYYRLMREASDKNERLRAALKPFADVGRKLRDARVCETGAIPAGASARFLKLEPLIAGDFVQAADAFDNEHK